MRDGFPILGDLVEYYQATWDPRALMVVNDISRFAFDFPYECTQEASTPRSGGRQWFSRYYDLTRDPQVVDRLKAWSAAGFDALTVNAFLYRTTGDASVPRNGGQSRNYRISPLYYDSKRVPKIR